MAATHTWHKFQVSFLLLCSTKKVPPLPCPLSLRAGPALPQGLAGFQCPPRPPFAFCCLRGSKNLPGLLGENSAAVSSRETRQAWRGAAWSCGEGRERNRGRGGTRLDKNPEQRRSRSSLRGLCGRRQRSRAADPGTRAGFGVELPRAPPPQTRRGKGGRTGKSVPEQPTGLGCPFCHFLSLIFVPPSCSASPPREGGSERAWAFSLLSQ